MIFAFYHRWIYSLFFRSIHIADKRTVQLKTSIYPSDFFFGAFKETKALQNTEIDKFSVLKIDLFMKKHRIPFYKFDVTNKHQPTHLR